VARTRKTSRRKGRRTGAIEVPRALFNRIWSDIRARFEKADASEVATGTHEQKLLAALFGWKDVKVLRPASELRLGGTVIPLPRPQYDIIVGTYPIPSARYRGKRLDLRVVLADPKKSRAYPTSAHLGAIAGHVEHSKEVTESTQKQRLAMLRAAVKATGLSLRDVRDARDEFDLELCSLTSRLGLTIVLFVPFGAGVDEVGMRRIRETLLHEMAHAMDEDVRRPWERHIERDNVSTCEEEVRAHFGLKPLFDYSRRTSGKRMEELPETPSQETLNRYYNLPWEVTARLSQIWNHLRTPPAQAALAWELRERSDELPGTVLLDYAYGLPPFRVMWNRLTPANQKRVMRALADMAAPVTEAAASRRGRTLPNRRTSRGRARKTSRRRAPSRRTSRNPGPRRTIAQQALIGELWGLVHRQLFLKAQGRPYKHLDARITQVMERLKRQGLHPGDVEWERLQAIGSAGRFEEIL
jgi:hypothetical protein